MQSLIKRVTLSSVTHLNDHFRNRVGLSNPKGVIPKERTPMQLTVQ